MVKVLAWGYAPPRRPTRFRLTYALPQDYAQSPASLHGPVDRGVDRGCLAAHRARLR